MNTKYIDASVWDGKSSASLLASYNLFIWFYAPKQRVWKKGVDVTSAHLLMWCIYV